VIASLVVLVILGLIVAATPSAVVTNLAFLLSKRGVGKSLAFLAGWEIVLVALTAMGAGLAFVALELQKLEQTDPLLNARLIGGAEVIVGIVMLIAAIVTLRRGQTQMERRMAKTLQTVDKVNWPTAFGFGAFGALLNLPWIIAASAEVVRAGQNFFEEASLFLVFLGVASVSVAIPAIAPLIWPKQSEHLLEQARGWLIVKGHLVAGAATGLVALIILYRGLQVLGVVPK